MEAQEIGHRPGRTMQAAGIAEDALYGVLTKKRY